MIARGASPDTLRPAGPFLRRVPVARRRPDDDVPLELPEDARLVARLEDVEELPVLLHHHLEARALAVPEEVGADPRPDRPPDLRRVRLARARDDDVVEAEVGLDDLEQVAGASRRSMTQICLPSSAKSASVITSRAWAKL